MDVKKRLLYKIFCYCETHFSLHVIILFLKRSILIKLSGPWSIQQSCFAVSFSQKVLNQKPLFSGARWPGQDQGLSHFPQHWVSRVSWPPRGHPGDTQVLRPHLQPGQSWCSLGWLWDLILQCRAAPQAAYVLFCMNRPSRLLQNCDQVPEGRSRRSWGGGAAPVLTKENSRILYWLEETSITRERLFSIISSPRCLLTFLHTYNPMGVTWIECSCRSQVILEAYQ